MRSVKASIDVLVSVMILQLVIDFCTKLEDFVSPVSLVQLMLHEVNVRPSADGCQERFVLTPIQHRNRAFVDAAV
jgi:hypothetical protein